MTDAAAVRPAESLSARDDAVRFELRRILRALDGAQPMTAYVKIKVAATVALELMGGKRD